MTRILPDMFFIGYSLMLVGVGLTGIFTAQWELLSVFHLDAAWLALPEGATFLNQYRFLKAAEAAFGLFCLLHRRDILGGGRNASVFLAGCALGIIARLWSWTMDGTPHAAFVVLLVLETLTFLLVWRSARNGYDGLK